MTEAQYYFPYFFSDEVLDKELEGFDVHSESLFSRKTQMPESLILTKQSTGSHTELPFGATIMRQGNKLYYWTSYTDIIELTEIKLDSDTLEKQNWKIDITTLNMGIHPVDIPVTNFVTYVRKLNLHYQLDYYEHFVIVIINDCKMNIIPFDSFNEKSGDYGYVWPALARFDVEKNTLYGRGMRMKDFIVDLNPDKPTTALWAI